MPGGKRYTVTLLPSAVSDLQDIAEFLVTESPFYADVFVSKLDRVFERLELFPHLGTPVNVPNVPLRRLVLDRYLIFYRLVGDVEILRIIHAARDISILIDDVE